MEVKLVEENKEKGTIKIEVDDATLVSLINENLWRGKKAEYAAWVKDHPYLSKPELVVKAKDPKAALVAAAEQVVKDTDTLKKAIQKAK